MNSLLLISVMILLSSPASCRFYQVTEGESGWTTGLRESNNISLNITGSAIGEGSYQRYTEMGFLEVRMRERIAASRGTLDTSERIHLEADTSNDVVGPEYGKYPGGQIFYITVNESWPVNLSAARSMDYVGRGISDREGFGNNLDCISASYWQARDLKKDRSCSLVLQNAWFSALINDATNTIIKDEFQPNKFTDYLLDSRSDGMVTLKHRQTKDRVTATESVESYVGKFKISRHLRMSNTHVNSTSVGMWPQCCEIGGEVPLERMVFAVNPDRYWNPDEYLG